MNYRIVIFIFLICFTHQTYSQSNKLRESIEQIIQSKNAVVGVSIIALEDKDTFSVNGNKEFVMFSVVKFYTALAVLDQVDKGNISLDQKVLIKKSDLNPNTYSPLRDERAKEDFKMTVAELLSYSVSKSDNIAYEKLAELLGGIQMVDKYIQQLGVKNISIVSTYKEGLELTLKNKNTPIAATQVLQKAYQGNILSKNSYDFLWKIMRETSTTPDRIKGLLPRETIVAHKSGSSGVGNNGITIACNDIGIITLPNNKHIAIAVFVGDSKEDDAANARIIAEISKATRDYFFGQ